MDNPGDDDGEDPDATIRLIELPTPVDRHSIVYDVNDNGWIVGEINGAGVATGEAVVWSFPGDGSQPTAFVLPNTPGFSMVARGVNNLGRVVGIGGEYGIWVWSEDHGIVSLPKPAGSSGAEVYSINDLGVAIGVTTTPEWSIVQWTISLDASDIQVERYPFPDGFVGHAFKINDAGTAVGHGNYLDQGELVAFRWSASTGIEFLQGLRVAWDVDSSGRVVGQTPSLEPAIMADGEIILLSGPVCSCGEVRSIDASGTLSGATARDSWRTTAVVWGADRQPLVLPSKKGFSWTSADAIGGNGLVAGVGLKDTYYRAVAWRLQ